MNPEYTKNLTTQEVGHAAAYLNVSGSPEALTSERLRELLFYNPETGVFTWRVDRQRSRAGTTAGSVMNTGYVRIVIDQQKFFAHRLAFLYMEGSFPEVQVDHIDHDRKNNQWTNLRKATRTENLRNRTIQANNTSGIKGVSRRSKSTKWTAQIVAKGRTINLGTFETIEEATKVYRKAGRELHGDFFNDGTMIGEPA
jgi:hypothetical protein